MVRVCCGMTAVYHSCSLCCHDALNAPFCIHHPMYLKQLTLEQPVEFFMCVHMTLFTLPYHLCTALHIKSRDLYFCYQNVDLFISSLIPLPPTEKKYTSDGAGGSGATSWQGGVPPGFTQQPRGFNGTF